MDDLGPSSLDSFSQGASAIVPPFLYYHSTEVMVGDSRTRGFSIPFLFPILNFLETENGTKGEEGA